jgi:fucose 4-O-acetylase-like acetyltransferase
MDRRKDIDIIKGFAIILMVYGHTFGVGRDFIYLFHVPVFIFISGYCFNRRHALDLASCERYFFSRVRRLVIPYMGFNIVFALLNNYFLLWNFYTDDPAFKIAVVPTQKAAQGLMQFRSLKELMIDVYDVITLKSIPQLSSASWFIMVLFLVCVVHCFVVYFVDRIDGEVPRTIAWLGLLVVVLLVAYAISCGLGNDAGIADRHLQFFEVYACYLLGFFVREIAERDSLVARGVDLSLLERFMGRRYAVFAAPIALVVLLAMVQINTLDMSKYQIVDPIFLVFATFMGAAFLASLAQDLENNVIGRGLGLIGKHTLSILFLHELCFKFVSILYCISYGLPKYMVASWPVIFDAPAYVNIAYTIAGVGLPLLAVLCWEKIKCAIK